MSHKQTILIKSDFIRPLRTCIEELLDIADDTVTDDLFISSECEQTSYQHEDMVDLRKSVNERIDILLCLNVVDVMITQQMSFGVSSIGLQLTNKQIQILHEQIQFYLSMIDDRIDDTSDVDYKDIGKISCVERLLKIN